MSEKARPPHPIVWTILYMPFGALGGFVAVSLTFLGSRHGLSITESSLLNGAQMMTQWLKWLWAPVIDITLSPKRWYAISTAASALGVVSLAAIPLSPSTLGLVLAVIAVASIINSVVGMAIETMMAAVTPASEIGRVSGYFQAGNLGGFGLGGGLGLFLLQKLPSPWMAGAVLGMLFMACCLALRPVPYVKAHAATGGAAAAVKGVTRDLLGMIKTRPGLLAALLCFLPLGTGAAQVVLTQEPVAALWGAGASHVEKVQGLLAGVVTAAGCFAGGAICQRVRPQIAYPSFGLALAAVASAMALLPATLTTYVAGNFVYAFCVGLAYAGFTAVVLDAMGPGSAATKYNIFASLSNFPIWWVGLLLGRVADVKGASMMLHTEAALGVIGVVVFAVATRVIKGRMPRPAAEAGTA